MLRPEAKARLYFQNAPNEPWRWAEQGKVLVWADGTTIAFHEELVEILQGLAPNGLPPFNQVVLVLAACKGKFPPSSATGPVIKEEPLGPWAWNDPANQEFSDLIARLRLLSQLPAELKNSPRAKAVLLEYIFEQVKVERCQPAREIISVFRDVPPSEAFPLPVPYATARSNGYRVLHAALSKFSPEALALRQRTGLDMLPEPAEVQLKPSAQARHLLDQLRTDSEYQGLAKVTRDVMAALYVPRSLSELDELPLGGFSDISNRGNLDRLLLSELANDDLTLATRIALKEALYIRREPPSHHPPTQLAILLDVGLRQWGLPRVFATAVALAFIAKEEHCISVVAWRARRHGIEKAELLSRAGLIQHLEALDTYVHPGAALKPFFAEFAQVPEMEAVLVTHPDSVSDPEFQRLLAEISWKTFYIATVDRDGAFELWVHPHRQNPLCRAQIGLSDLFPKTSSTPARAALRDERYDPNLPLILAVHPFPFLLPMVGKVDHAIQLPNNGGVAAMKDRRLLSWHSFRKGARTLLEKLPAGKTIWLGAAEGGKRYYVLKHQSGTGETTLSLWDELNDQSATYELESWHGLPLRVFEQAGILFVIGREIAAYEINTGQLLGKIPNPSMQFSSHGRYFQLADGQWHFLGYDGTSLRFYPVTLRFQLSDAKVLALFDRVGFESLPWALTNQGEVYGAGGKLVLKLGLKVAFFSISSDGHRLLVNGVGEPDFHVLDFSQDTHEVLSGKYIRKCYSMAGHHFELPVSFPTRSMRTRFAEIYAGPPGHLLLKNLKGAWYRIALEGNALQLRSTQNLPSDLARVRKFEPISLPPECCFSLKLASWPRGNRAWLDSRGLLHLKPANASELEVCIVLHDGAVAAWSSDNQICGNPFFLAGNETATAARLMGKIEAFCHTT